jgi:FAD/FMN-containing dehydrogenase
MRTKHPGVWPLALCCVLSSACAPKIIPDDAHAHVPLASAPTWANWSGDLVYQPTSTGEFYYFSPTTREELQKILAKRPAGMKVRVSGQRHSQPPLVLADNRGGPPPEAATTWVIDLSCYHDLGTDGAEVFQLDAANGKLTVNTGVREDHIDGFLTNNDLMLRTVTAGGFFSVGGMTAIDVHGATINAPIFAETVSAFTIMAADGSVTTIDQTTAKIGDWSPLQFARVSLGALGIVTSVTIDVQPRPYATTLKGGQTKFKASTEAAFIEQYTQLLLEHNRLESFWNPYSNEFRVLWWDIEAKPKKTKNKASQIASSCTFAENDMFGAPFEDRVVEKIGERAEQHEQLHGSDEGAKLLIDFAMDVIEAQAHKADKRHSDLWLLDAAEVIFMSYFVELPNDNAQGLHTVWEGLQAVKQANSDTFRVAGPLEFRFIRGGDSVMAGTYTTTPDALFVNLDLIGFVDSMPASQYPPAMLDFFAAVERKWVALGGWPHNGKMYGFYDPGTTEGSTPPFNPAFLTALTERRHDRVAAFEDYRRSRDPEGVFCNTYLGSLGLCQAPEPEPEPEPEPANTMTSSD